MNARLALPVVLSGMLVVCCGKSARESVEYTARLADGAYRTAYAQGYDPADEASILAVTAHLNTTAQELVLYLADGSQHAVTFLPRPRSQWQKACATMASHFLNEVGDLSPAPLQLAKSLTFNTPLAYSYCSSNRMIIADDYNDQIRFIAFDWYAP